MRAVGEALRSPNVVVRDFALGYFEQVKTAARRRARAAAARRRGRAGAPARRRHPGPVRRRRGERRRSARSKDAPRRRLNALIDLFAQVRTGAALDALFELMATDDFDTNRAACDALVAVVPALGDKRARRPLPPRRRPRRRRQGAPHRPRRRRQALRRPRRRQGPQPLFAMLDAREPHVVRTHALGALVQCLRGQSLTARRGRRAAAAARRRRRGRHPAAGGPPARGSAARPRLPRPPQPARREPAADRQALRRPEARRLRVGRGREDAHRLPHRRQLRAPRPGHRVAQDAARRAPAADEGAARLRRRAQGVDDRRHPAAARPQLEARHARPRCGTKLQDALEKREDRLYAALHTSCTPSTPSLAARADPRPRRAAAQGQALRRERPLAHPAQGHAGLGRRGALRLRPRRR